MKNSNKSTIAIRALLPVLMGCLLYPLAAEEAEGQIFRQLGDRLKAVTGPGSSGEGDEASAEASEQRSAQGSGSMSGAMSMFGFGGNAKSENEYVFDASIKYDIEVKGKRNRTDQLRLTLMHREGAAYSGTQVESLAGGKRGEQEGVMITDTKNGVMVMLTETNRGKQSIVIPLATMGMLAGRNASSADSGEGGAMPAFEDIGTKVLLGKQARGYRLRDKAKVIEFWTTNDMPAGLRRLLLESRQQGAIGGFLPAYMPMGLLLEMVSRDESSGEMVTMTAKEINVDKPVRYVMAQYPRQG